MLKRESHLKALPKKVLKVNETISLSRLINLVCITVKIHVALTI